MANQIFAREEKIEIITAGGHSIILDDAADTISITTNSDSNPSRIVLDDSHNTVSLESNILEVRANNRIHLEAPSIEIVADGSLKIQSGQINMEGRSLINFSGAMIKLN